MGSLAYCFEKKKELLSVPGNLWSVISFRISDCVIDLCRFDLTKEERIDYMERNFNDGQKVVDDLVQNDSELKVKTDALYEYLRNVRGFTYEIIDLHGIPYTDRLSAEEQVEFEKLFGKRQPQNSRKPIRPIVICSR
jgi:hypothetical protein